MDSKAARLALIAVLLCLPAPFVYMKIGPEGYVNYGPDVPDIWIIGAYIFGKDTSFWGIGFAWKWQLAAILWCAFNLLMFIIDRRIVRLWVNIFLLACFPVWLWTYTGGVVNNSDGADLSIYPMPGLFLWFGLLVWHVRFCFQNLRLRRGKKQTDLLN